MENNMFPSLKLLILISLFLVFALLYVLLFVPGEYRKARKKKKESAALPNEAQKKELDDLRARFEKQIQHLKHDISGWERKDTLKEKELLLEKAKTEKFKEKILQERGWHEKEQGEIERRGKELQELKKELLQYQENYAHEHSQVIKLSHEVDDLKREFSVQSDQRRGAEAEAAMLKTKLDESRHEVVQLKRENIELNKKKEDTQWVAKSEVARLERMLIEKDKELERVKRIIKEETQ
jgi:hypothetical protein